MEILHTYIELSDKGEVIIALGILMISICGFISAALLDFKKKKSGYLLLVFTGAILISLIYNYPKLPRDTYYEVNLDTLTEFDYKNYRIISQKEKIVTIKEEGVIKWKYTLRKLST